jgi:hypothetical protein
VLFDAIKSERLVILVPVAFINFFAIGFVTHGVIFGFQTLDLAHLLVCITDSMIIFYGEFILLLIPTKVLIDRKFAPEFKNDREIIRLSFDEQDKEIFRSIKLASNSFTLLMTGLINYFLIGLFLFMLYSNDGQPLPAHTVINGLVPIYIFFIVLNFLAVTYDMLKSKNK